MSVVGAFGREFDALTITGGEAQNASAAERTVYGDGASA